MQVRLFLLLSVVLSAYAYGMEGAEKDTVDPSPTLRPLKIIEPHVPITTGFFDRTLQDSTKDKEVKLKAAENYVFERQEKYELFLEQINMTYSRRHYQERERLLPSIERLRDFFEDKLLGVGNKFIHFKGHIEDISPYSKEHFSLSPVGIYSGKLHGKPEEQAEYAAEKYREYLFMVNFLDQYPLPKASANPIIQRAIRGELNILSGKLGKRISHCIDGERMKKEEVSMSSTNFSKFVLANMHRAQSIIDGIVVDSTIDKINDLISDEYSLRSFAGKHLEKWQHRLNHKEKEELTSKIFKLLIDSPSLKEDSNPPALLKDKEKELNVDSGEKEPVSKEK